MRTWLMLMFVGILGALLLAGPAQGQKKEKEKEKDKGPMYPPVNPAIAKLEITVTGLEGPGFGIGYGKASGLLAAGCESGAILVYKKDTLAAFIKGTGKPDVLKAHEGPVRVLDWNGGPTMVSAGVDKKVNFWKMPEGKVAQTGASDFRVRSGALSQDGKTFALAGESEVIQLWDASTGKPTAKLTDKMEWTNTVAFSADGKQLLSGDYLGIVRLWDVAGAKKVAELPAKPVPAPKIAPDPIAASSVSFAPDGKTIVMGTADGPIHFINLADGKILRTLTGHVGPVTGIVFHPTGTLMATSGKDRTVKLWNPAAPQPLKSLEGHTAWIEGITFVEEGTKLATVGADATIRIWDLAEPVKKK